MNKGKFFTLLDAVVATGASDPVLVDEFERLVFMLDTADSTNATIKFVGSNQADEPDFSAAKSASNHWDHLFTINGSSGASVQGNTGVVLTGTDTNAEYIVNSQTLRWVGVIVTAWAAGTINVKLRAISLNR